MTEDGGVFGYGIGGGADFASDEACSVKAEYLFIGGMSRLMLKSAKQASPMINLCGFHGLGKMLVH